MRKRFWTMLLLPVLLAALLVELRNRGAAVESDPQQPTEMLPCAAYKEHRKEVNVGLEVPTLGKAKATRVKVLEVTDGDTLVIQKGSERVRVRLMGMDSP